MTTAFIGLGSNLGDGRQTLQLAWRRLGEIEGITIEDLSAPYLSAPVAMDSDNWFTNSVGRLETELQPLELLEALLRVEAGFGRRREAAARGYQDRTLDLDLLYYGDVVLRQERLVLPHPHLGERLFTLKPLAELAPCWRDPGDGLSIADKLAGLEEEMRTGKASPQEISRGSWS